MTLRLNVAELTQRVARSSGFRTVGRLRSVRDIVTARLPAALGEQCLIAGEAHELWAGEVIGVADDHAQLMCYRHAHGLRVGMEVVATGRSRRAPVGWELLGRTLDGLGAPIDGRGPLAVRRWSVTADRAPAPLERQPVREPLVTGQRVLDGLLTIGRGQRIGLFAGSGVGKSTLLGQIARSASADVNVVALIGERGREVRPFLEDALGEQGLARSVVVVATSDETPLMRIQAVRTAITIAERFRTDGAHVLFFLDSLTRFAAAQRELGLARGEVPGARGYPGSVQTTLARLLERLGCDAHGAITGLITVLVDGDDLDEPISDAARGILDGHVVLSRRIAARGRFPAVDVLPSVSRLFTEITTPEHQRAAARVRNILATYAELEDLIQIGAYQPGTSPKVDKAIQLLPAAERFLRQDRGETCGFDDTVRSLRVLADAWTYGDS